VIIADDEGQSFIPDARQTFGEITRIPDFGPAIATRLIALVRPDRGISLNKGSIRGLSMWLTGRSEPSLPVDEKGYLQLYLRLLYWLYSQRWYQASEPRDPRERIIWSMRAALIDCFVYERV
jgi:hypothetical protein